MLIFRYCGLYKPYQELEELEQRRLFKLTKLTLSLYKSAEVTSFSLI